MKDQDLMSGECVADNCADAIAKAKTMAAVSRKPITVWRLGDVEMGFAVSSKAPIRPCRPSVQVDPDGTEHC